MDDDNTAIVTLEPSDLAEVTIPETPGAPEPRRKGRRTLPILAGVAVLSLAAGFGLSHLVVNPAEVAARTAPPQAGLITVPIEHRPLSNDVNIRGDVMFDGATNLVVETAEMATRPIVTGMIPEVGQELGAGDVALEVAGRPVILLPGGLPTYRSLRMGTSGPDVVQLREALDYLGFDAGDLDSDTFDADLAGAVAALYLSTGFDPPSPSEGASAHLDAATQRLSSARENLARANTDLTEADSGPDPVAVASADAQIRAAQDQYEIAQASQRDFDTTCADPANAADPMLCGEAARLQVQAQVNSARDGVHLAQVARNALNAAPDLTMFRQAITAAQQEVTAAQEALDEAQDGVLPYLPASEAIFLETLPRRVDHVNVSRGDTLTGTAVMSVSGAELKVTAGAISADAALLNVGDIGFIDLDGELIEATIEELIAPDPGSGGRHQVSFVFHDLTNEQVVALRHRNVRITIPVASTEDDVLTVPLAALTAGPGGESRIEVLWENGETELVLVTTGLAAGGHVEIEGVDRDLTPGLQVVIGSGAPAANSDAEG